MESFVEYRRCRNLNVLFMMLVVGLITALGVYLMYRSTLDHTGDRLQEVAAFQARLVQAISDVERVEHGIAEGEDPENVIREHIAKTFGSFHPLGKTVEYRVGEWADGAPKTLSKSSGFAKGDLIPKERQAGWRDQAMLLALEGKNGRVLTRDRRGASVLAAYEPVSGTDMGVVAQIDLYEIREEFIRTGAIFVAVALLLTLFASVWMVRSTNPLLEKIRIDKERYQFAVEAADEGIWDWDLATGKAWRSPGVERIYGLEPGTMGDAIDDWKVLIHPEDWPGVESSYKSALAGTQDEYQREYRIRHRDGSWLWCHAKGKVVARNPQGQPLRIVGTLRDITRRKEAEIEARKVRQRLQESERHFRTLFERAPLSYLSLDAQGRIIEVNHAWLEMLGYRRDEVIGHAISEFLAPESRKLMPERFVDYLESGNVQDLVFTLLRKNGQPVEVLVNGRISHDEEGSPLNTHCILTNLTEQQRISRQVAEERKFLQSVIDGVADPIMVIGLNYEVQLMNRAAAQLSIDSECPGHECVHCYQLSHHSDRPCEGDDHPCPLQLVLESGQVERVVHTHYDHNGEPRIHELAASPLRDEGGELIGIIEAVRDITDRVQLQEQLQRKERHLQHMAYHDALTDLPNRDLFLDRLEHALQLAERNGDRVAVLFIDLDRFKEINDSFGHKTGDLVLQLVADRLWQSVREEDTLARLGGDEFVLLLGDLKHGDDASRVARKLIDAFSLPINTGKNEFFLTASIGISIFPTDGADAESLLKNADAAMYRAKAEGRNTYQFYDREMTARAFERVLMEGSLRTALDQDQFELFYQPQINVESDRVVGVEALIRWNHPEKGAIPPARFLPLAEESGLITLLDGWVLEHACRQCVSWHEQGFDPGRVAINLSGRQLASQGLLQRIEKVLERTGCHPEWIELEITEGFVMQQPEQSVRLFSELQHRGIELAIDDFGTGYSSLSYLKRLPINKLKIDRAFVQDLPRGQSDAAIAKTVISLGENLRLKVVAEGVETRDQMEYLRQQGCLLVQGFLYARPMPAEEFTQFLQQQNSRQGSA